MAKRSKRRQVPQNKDHAGCMWGLISIFDFRHVRTTRRLLSDRRIVTKDIVASEYSTSGVNLPISSEETHVSIEDTAESEKSTLDVVRTSVKELMEEEMVSEQDSSKETDGDEVEKFSKKSSDDHEISINCQVSSQKTSQYSDLENLMKEILLIYQRKNNHELDEGQNRTFTVFEEKLSAAVEVFMNEKSSDGNQERIKHSKDFIDTLQMLSANKELFLKLLQDQASLHADEDKKSKSKLKSTDKSNLLGNVPNSPHLDVPAARKHRNIFRRRSKSQESMPVSRIVILKPNSLDNHIKADSEKISSHFSFMELKKRLKNAMGKEQTNPGGNEKTVTEGSNGWSSPNRDHFYTERFAKRAERVSKLKESKIKQKENGDSSRHISNIYIEAKKHLSDLLNGADEDTDLMNRNLSKSLGRILSFPEYNPLSPVATPRKENEHGIVTALPSCGNLHSVNESRPNHEEKLKACDKVNLDTCMGGTPCSMMEDSPKGVVEIENQEEMEVLDGFCEPCCSSESMDDDELGEVTDEERSPRCSKLDPCEENEFSSPMGPSHSCKIEEAENTANDKSGRPSPVSVLEPLFSDNEISPSSTISRHNEYAIQPVCIQFDDQETYVRSCMENEESAFEYVEAVLLASDLNWDEFEKRWISSIEILDSSLFDEVEIFSSRPSHDQRLLFDSTNEILKELCDSYLGFFLQLSFIKNKVQPVPKGENLINEVWQRIESHLKNNYPLSLDHLVRKDLGISRTWMDLGPDSREMVFEIDESIFEDMMEETLLSLVDD